MPRIVFDNVAPRGAFGNFWNAAATGTSAPSGAVGIDTQSGTPVTVMISTSATATFTVWYSPDNSHWYVTAITLALTGAVTGTLDITTGARFIALQSNTNVTATATIQAK